VLRLLLFLVEEVGDQGVAEVAEAVEFHTALEFQ
jgi:hypothetical protein